MDGLLLSVVSLSTKRARSAFEDSRCFFIMKGLVVSKLTDLLLLQLDEF
jgi:hypothetical protein